MPEPTDWQLIDSAPKDGTWFLVVSICNEYAKGVLQHVDGRWLDWRDHEHDISNFTHWLPFPNLPRTPHD